jgi:glucose-6-phosphate isomerase
MWYYAGNGKGEKDMVILPYKDRLALFAKYLQQLVMESLGKEKDLDGKIVHQGIAVYGNKGSTDQHAYVQQLRDGVLNFFVTFIEVGKDQRSPAIEIENGVTSGDYLHGFLRGTRSALYDSGRESITISIPEASTFNIGPGKTAEEIARSIEADPEDVFHVLRHLASNDPHIRISHSDEPADDQFSYTEQNAAD